MVECEEVSAQNEAYIWVLGLNVIIMTTWLYVIKMKTKNVGLFVIIFHS